jgi:hypothetical protein
MKHNKAELANMLPSIDFGSSIAELDTLLESARVETSAFTDLFNDKVDLVPGTKGSGKSALYRIFVDFLAEHLLEHKKVVVAHGVQHRGDNVFHAYKNEFDKMDENEFVNFWCVYLVSLAKENFIKKSEYTELLKNCSNEIKTFYQACQSARIPDFENQKSLREVLGWVLAAIRSWKPRIKFRPPGEIGEIEVDLFGEQPNKSANSKKETDEPILARYAHNIKNNLEAILKKAGLSLWLMIDRLDEIFPRRSKLETCALRGLLRTLRIFESQEIRVKVFLRDDILEQVVSSGQGFTALTHITARKSDTLGWSEDQILNMIVRRLYANENLRNYLKVNYQKLETSRSYQKEAFYKVFPKTVFPGKKQSSTLRWIYKHTSDGRGVVTPRDVIDLLTKAKQKQQDEYKSDPSGMSEFIIGSSAIKYGLSELSKRKRTTFLEAEFPHLWIYIKKFIGGRTQYNENDISKLFGKNWSKIVEDLISIGVLSIEGRRHGTTSFKIPFLYRAGLEVRQGSA